MKIEAGKFYRMRNGRPAAIFRTDHAGKYSCHGALESFGCVTPALWTAAGRCADGLESVHDLVAPWDDTELDPRDELKVDPYAELKAAHKAGKVIQINHGTDWKDISDPSWGLHPSQYRIKPEPKTVPLSDPADWIVGGPWWVRIKRLPSTPESKILTLAMVVGIAEGLLKVECVPPYDKWTPEKAAEKLERTNDGETWLPCTKEAPQ